jgi:hypothetical protein
MRITFLSSWSPTPGPAFAFRRRQLDPLPDALPDAPGHCADSWFDSAMLALGDGLGDAGLLGVVDGRPAPVVVPVADGETLADAIGFTEALGAVVSAVQSAPSTESVCTIDWASDRLVAVIVLRTHS